MFIVAILNLAKPRPAAFANTTLAEDCRLKAELACLEKTLLSRCFY